MILFQAVEDLQGRLLHVLDMRHITFVTLCHVSGSNDDIVLKAVVKTDEFFILRVFRCHTVCHADARHPDKFCSRDFQHTLINSGCREHQACILLVHIKKVFRLRESHAL